MSNPASDEGAASTAAETQTQQPPTSAPAQAQQRQPRSREGGQQREDRRDDRPRVERRDRRDDRDDRRYPDDDYGRRPRRSYDDDYDRPRRDPQPQGSQVNGLVWALSAVALTLLVLWLIGKFGPGTPVAPAPGPNPAPQAFVPNPAPAPVPAPVVNATPLDPAAAAALMGAPGSGFVSGPATGRGPQIFSLQETNLPGIGRCYMVNVSERRGISAPPGTNIPAPEYQMANPPTGLRWVATDKPDPNKPGAVYYVLAP